MDDHGEQCTSRGLGLDYVPCLWCPSSKRELRDNIALFVDSKDSGERILAMMSDATGGGKAWLDYRSYEPSWIQVKIGACVEHLANLRQLDVLIRQNKCITPAILALALRAKG